MQLTIVRHGQTNLNALGIVQGSGINEPLNAIGLEQANLLFSFYKTNTFSAVLHSELVRTKQTVLNWQNHANFLEQAFWNEMNWGSMEGQKPTQENTLQFNTYLKDWQNGNLNIAAFGGETPLQVAERQQAGIEFLWKNFSNQSVLICTHGRAIRILLCLLTQTDLKNMDTFNHSNTAVYQLKSDATKKFTIHLKNNTDHLK